MKLLRQFKVNELGLECFHYSHAKSNAQLFHIQRSPELKDPSALAIGFPTPVWDSKGTPHILEHVALCGSARYPVRDPFFKMLNRSQATYMNAWTFSDMTIYPFSSLLRKDVLNLRDIYSDAVFNPLIRRADFAQEGWRLASDKIKGVVYNEMKGAFSNTNDLYQTRLQSQLFKDTLSTYQFVSGGDPTQIPLLSYQELVDFHRSQYSFKNAKIFSFGSQFPHEDHLDYFDRLFDAQKTTKHGQKLPLKTKLWNAPRHISETCPTETTQTKDQSKVSISWLIPEHQDLVQNRFNIKIMTSLLMDGQSSPIYKALIESGLGSDYHYGAGINDYGRDMMFSVGVNGVVEKNVNKVQDVIYETLHRCCASSKNWMSEERINSILHQLELSVRLPKRDYGIGLAPTIIGDLVHGIDIEQDLDISSKINNFKRQFRGGQLFEEMIKSILDNQHKLTFIMRPDQLYSQHQNNAEEAFFKNLYAKLDKNQRKILDTKEAKSEDVEDLSVLPTIQVKDLSRTSPVFQGVKTSDKSLQDFPLQSYVGNTNGLSYVKMMLQLNSSLSDQLRPYVPLYTSVLTSLGTKNMSAEDFEQQIKKKTGGISFSPTLVVSPHNSEQLQDGISFGSMCLPQNVPAMYELLFEALRNVNLDNKSVLKTHIGMAVSSLQSSIPDSGSMYASSRSMSSLSYCKQFSELYGGLTHIKFLNKLLVAPIDQTVEKLWQLHDILHNGSQIRVSLHTGSQQQYDQNIASIKQLLQSTNYEPQFELDKFSLTSSLRLSGDNVFVKAPFSTSFASSSYKIGVAYLARESVHLRILASIVASKYIHVEVREKNGAYGSSCSYDSLNGLLNFTSYRDPAPFKTLETFDGAFQSAKHFVTSDNVNEAKLALLKQLDYPKTVNQYGQELFSNRITDELRQSQRTNIFDTQVDDVLSMADKIIGGKHQLAKTVLGSGEVPSSLNRLWEVQSYE